MDGDYYLLPSHPTVLSSDPLGTCDQRLDDDPPLTAWAVLEASVAAFRTHTFSLWHLPDLIQDLAYSLHDNGRADAGFLRRFLQKTYPDPTSSTARAVLDDILGSALALPTLFPTHTIPYLNILQSPLNLNRFQVRSLIAHQLLGTMRPPRNNKWGCNFTCWYSNHQPLKHAIRGYLATLFYYFQSPPVRLNPVIYEFCSVPPPPPELGYAWLSSDAFLFDFIDIEPVDAVDVPFPRPGARCTLMSSSSSPGFGPSCTQEELITAACPDLLPLGALCVSPPIPSHSCLIARGVAPMSEWQGQGRQARRIDLLDDAEEHTFLLLDASEIDMAKTTSSLPDLSLEYLLRDLHKAYTGFSSIRSRDITEISTPLWGTGAFGGDPVVKTIILGIAGALTGVTVRLTVDDRRAYPSRGLVPESKRLTPLLQSLKSQCRGFTVHGAWTLMTSRRVVNCVDGMDLARIFMEPPPPRETYLDDYSFISSVLPDQ